MPTAEEFERIAAELDALADEAAMLVHPVRTAFDTGVLVGGRLTRDVEQALDDCQHDATAARFDLHAAADECRRRAEVCRQHHAALRQWQAATAAYEQATGAWAAQWVAHQANPIAMPAPGPRPAEPIRPVKPAAWVD